MQNDLEYFNYKCRLIEMCDTGELNIKNMPPVVKWFSEIMKNS
jgi:hypothetical protein